MKKFKKILLTLTASMLLLIPILSTPINAQAADPVTFYVKYLPDLSTWRFQTKEWKEGQWHFDLVFLKEQIKDGDHLVIEGSVDLALDVGVYLSSLTVVECPLAIVTTKGIDNVYLINGSTSAINGDVKNAYVYDNSVGNFNNNVSYLEIIRPKENYLAATVAVLGTLDHVKAYGKDFLHFEYYAFEANTFLVRSGELKTDASKYSRTPVATTTPVVTTPSAPADEYDSVPKTGDARFNPLWLVGIAAVCMVGGYVVKRKVSA